MTVLVDAPIWRWRGRLWAHLVSDQSVDELHAFAAELGLPPQAFHGDHYDLPSDLRDDAIALGAIAVDGRELVRRLRAAGLRRRSPGRGRHRPYDRPMAADDIAPLTVFHNPRCSNSRRAVEALEARGAEFDTVLYLKQPPGRADLERIVGHLQGDVTDLVRRDARFTELGLDRDGYATAGEVVDLLVEHPELMQRPLLETPATAVIARPPEAVVAELLGDA